MPMFIRLGARDQGPGASKSNCREEEFKSRRQRPLATNPWPLAPRNSKRQKALATFCLSSQLVSPAKGGQARGLTIRLLGGFDKLIFMGPRRPVWYYFWPYSARLRGRAKHCIIGAIRDCVRTSKE